MPREAKKNFMKVCQRIVHAIYPISLALLFSPLPLEAAAEPSAPPANVILLIGDGMDDVQISIARNYLAGSGGRLVLDSLPGRGAVQVLTVKEEDPSQFVYVADSANSATAMATGSVTSRGRIATTAGTDQDLVTILERAATRGLKTGLVTTSSVTDATPASFAAHIKLRICADPENMVDVSYKGIPLGSCKEDLIAEGGLGSISEQLARSPVDIILGGGKKHFEVKTENGQETVAQLAQSRGFEVVDSLSELRSIPLDRRILGLFAQNTLPVRTQGEEGREAEQASPSLLNKLHWYLGSVELPAPMICVPNPDYGETPSLKAMTEAALGRLNHDNSKGFFLMVESASIDKQAHARNACGSIGELEQLDEALASALEFANENPNTLIMMTADHGHAAQIVPYESLFTRFGAPVYPPGHLVRLITPEGSGLAINYATSSFVMEEHTGAQVPMMANETGDGLVPALMTQPEIYGVLLKHLELTDSP